MGFGSTGRRLRFTFDLAPFHKRVYTRFGIQLTWLKLKSKRVSTGFPSATGFYWVSLSFLSVVFRVWLSTRFRVRLSFISFLLRFEFDLLLCFEFYLAPFCLCCVSSSTFWCVPVSVVVMIVSVTVTSVSLLLSFYCRDFVIVAVNQLWFRDYVIIIVMI